jgi:predicted transcriptional regulator of viral defense system
LIDRGVTRTVLARAVGSGLAVQYMRGVFCGEQLIGESGLDFAALTLANPGAVVCLLSAAQFHDLSDEDPARIWMAVDRSKTTHPLKESPGLPVQTLYWATVFLEKGVETREIAGVEVRMTDAARTVIDMVRSRSKIGDEPAMKALHDYVRSGAPINDLWERAEEIGRRESVEPFIRAADEFRESVPVRKL